MIHRLLRWLTDAALADSIAGDLQEERRRRSRAIGWRATAWYWRVAIGLVLHAAVRILRDRATPEGARVGARGALAALRQAARALRRTPATALVIVATLAVALGLNTAVFSLVHGVLLDPLPFDRAADLVFVQGTRRGEPPSIGAQSSASSTGKRNAGGITPMTSADRPFSINACPIAAGSPPYNRSQSP